MTEMASDMRGIDVFVRNIIIDCYKNAPDEAQVIVTCVQNYSDQVCRDFKLDIAYISGKKQKDRFSGPVHVDRGDAPEDHATLIRNMIAAHGIPADVSRGRINNIEAKIVSIKSAVLRNLDMWLDNAADILGVAPAAVANAHYRIYKKEVSGKCISGQMLFSIGSRLKMSADDILNHLNAYYTR